MCRLFIDFAASKRRLTNRREFDSSAGFLPSVTSPQVPSPDEKIYVALQTH